LGGGSVVTQCNSEASAGQGDNGKHKYINGERENRKGSKIDK
jgi:hypothetical protein